MAAVEEPDADVHGGDVVGRLDDLGADDGAERDGRPGEDAGDADDPAEHVRRHDRLPQRAGVDVEQQPEAARRPPTARAPPGTSVDDAHERASASPDTTRAPRAVTAKDSRRRIGPATSPITTTPADPAP